jgi:porin
LLPRPALSQALQLADDEESPKPTAPPSNGPSGTAPQPKSFWQQDRLTGDWGGLRKTLGDEGLTLTLDYVGEALGNVTGGFRRGAIYENLFTGTLEYDPGKLLGWQGALFHASFFQIDGRGLSQNDLHNLFTPSEIEARRATRLFTLWLQQTLFDGALSLRAGELAADDEFIISNTAAQFINSCFGWPPFMGLNLPSGGPAYPLATNALRVELDPTDAVKLRAAIFAGDPAGQPGPLDPQIRDKAGTAFSTADGVFTIFEGEYDLNQEKDASGPPGSYKLGGWYHSGQFADERLDRTSGSLAAPGSGGVALEHHGDYGFYAVADQMIWRPRAGADEGLSVFLRLGWQPEADRNLVTFYADSGLAYKGAIPGREDDIVGIAFAYGAIGSDAAALDRDQRALTPGYPVRDYEGVAELTYRVQLAPWWTLQPDLQYILHPGGNVPSPVTPLAAKPVKNALMLGLRTTLKF